MCNDLLIFFIKIILILIFELVIKIFENGYYKKPERNIFRKSEKLCSIINKIDEIKFSSLPKEFCMESVKNGSRQINYQLEILGSHLGCQNVNI